MARHLTQTLIKPTKLIPIPMSRLFPTTRRPFSGKAQLIEVDLDSPESTGDLGLKRLEDAIHSIIVRRLAPDWLPFRPGSSYWVPPKKKADNILELVGKLTNPLSDEESLSLYSARGWPSSSFFIDEESVSEHPIPVEVEVQVQVRSSPGKKLPEDEE